MTPDPLADAEAKLARLKPATKTTPKPAPPRPGPPRLSAEVRCLAEVEPRAVEWLWPGRIPSGRITLLVGRPGCGKSFVTCDIAARLSRGAHWPASVDINRPGDTLLVCAEDDPADTIVPRLVACDADRKRVHTLEGVKVEHADGEKLIAFDLHNVELLRESLARLPDCRLVVIDPIGSYLGGGVDAHRDNEVRSVLAPLAALAAERNVAVLIVCHTRKGAADFADDTALGSRAFTGIARVVLHLSADADDRERRLLLPGKCNIGPPAAGLAFRIAGEPPRPEWEAKPLEGMHADDTMQPPGGRESGGKKTDAAAAWLRERLAGGPVGAKEIRSEVEAAGLTWKTVRNAADALGIIPRKSGFSEGWRWELPDGVPTRPPEDALSEPRSGPDSPEEGHLRETPAKKPRKCKAKREDAPPPRQLGIFGDETGIFDDRRDGQLPD